MPQLTSGSAYILLLINGTSRGPGFTLEEVEESYHQHRFGDFTKETIPIGIGIYFYLTCVDHSH
jgi:hypothetical protein